MDNTDVAEILWGLAQANWQATTTKERISKQNIKELIRKFILEVLDVLHDGKSDFAYRQAIEGLTLEKVIKKSSSMKLATICAKLTTRDTTP
jgi:hypothetical protein